MNTHSFPHPKESPYEIKVQLAQWLQRRYLQMLLADRRRSYWLSCLKINFTKNSFRNPISVSNSLDPDQTRHFVRLDLGANCLQRLSADDKKCHWKAELKQVQYYRVIILILVNISPIWDINPLLHGLFLDHDIIFFLDNIEKVQE